jgi:hypothetical protein
MIDLKNVGLPDHIFIPFWCRFYVLIQKICALAVSHLTVTLQMISNNRRSFSSISVYMYDSFLNRYVTPWNKNSGVTLLTGCLPTFCRTSCDQNSNFCLLDLSASEHWSPVRICSCYSSFTELLSYEKPPKHVFLELQHTKTLKIVKIGSSNTTFFWSVFWYQVYSSSYP